MLNPHRKRSRDRKRSRSRERKRSRDKRSRSHSPKKEEVKIEPEVKVEAEPKKISRFSGGLEAFKKARAMSPSAQPKPDPTKARFDILWYFEDISFSRAMFNGTYRADL